MLIFEWIVGVLLGAVFLAAAARRIGVPYPAFLAIGGVVLAFVPSVPNIRLDPDLALGLFLAPVLLDAGFDTSLRDLKHNWIPIAGLVLGAVGLTTAAVAIVARMLMPELPLAAAVVLGAIVAPPDAVAATSVLRQIKLPHRILTILEGESLLNDASALLIYRLAVGAVAAGAFSWSDAAPTFLIAIVGSLVAGPVLGLLYNRVLRVFSDAPSAIILQFVGAFGVWILAERVGLSGVLTIVSFAMTVARASAAGTAARLRVPSFAVWETAVFVLNVLAFVLIGIQIGPILENLQPGEKLAYLTVAGAIFATVVIVRVVWVMGFQAGSAMLGRRVQPDPGSLPPVASGAVLSWSGMRGLLTIATALALPEAREGAAFPFRDFIVLTAFVVVLGTLVLQGLTLRPLIAWLDLKDDDPVGLETGRARAAAYQAARDEIADDSTPAGEALRQEFSAALDAAEQHPEGLAPEELPTDPLRRRATEAARRRVLAMRDSGEIGDAAFHQIEEELDWSELSTTPREQA